MTIIASEGGTVRVYRFQLFDIISNDYVMSTRYATEQTIVKLGGRIKSIPFEVPASHVDDDGLTEKDYNPVLGASS
jgi:hypothetical protein